jgi:6-phosphogluconate dehydrogenase
MHTPQTLGLIGLGRMGLNMAARLTEQGIAVVGVDAEIAARAAAADAGVRIVPGIQELLAALPTPSVVWIMVPSRYVDDVLASLVPLLITGDVVIDGGNSFYKDSLRRHGELSARGIRFLDVGTSGGVSGARNGAAIMVGGEVETFLLVEPLFATLAAPGGYARVGGPGAGHFVKMVHNGIEYGMMGAIAEGMGVLKEHAAEFDISLTEVLKPYEHESVISGKLMMWLRQAYEEGQVEGIAGEVPRGETESEMEYITTIGEVPVLEAALEQRRATRVEPSYVGKLIAAMRNQFGGHRVIPIGEHESST